MDALFSHLLLAAVACTAIACGPSSKRDMSMPPRELTYADACNLQDYFNQRSAAGLAAPKAADEMVATNAKGQTIGEGSYVLQDPLSRRRFARLLRDEYGGVDTKYIHAVERGDGRVIVHVRWWDAGPIKRLRPDSDVLLETPAGQVELPPNPCVSDLLFGDKVYAMRARYQRNEVDLATDHPLSSGSSDPSLPPAPVASPSASSPTP